MTVYTASISAASFVTRDAPALSHAAASVLERAGAAAADIDVARLLREPGAVGQALRGERQLSIAVLGRLDDPYAANIARELRSLGVDSQLMDVGGISVVPDADRTVAYAGRQLQLDGAVAYHGAILPAGGMETMQAMQDAGIGFVNTPEAIAVSRDKWLAGDAMQQAGIDTPTTRLLTSSGDAIDAIRELGSPTIFKLRVGTEGRGVFKLGDPSEALPVVEAFLANDTELVAQRMVPVAHPSDVRAFVVGDRVVATMERTAAEKAGGLIKDFRANVSNGGTARAIQLTPHEQAQAVAATKAMGLDIGGVDLMGDAGSRQVIEVNSGPGQKISEVTGVNVAAAIAEHARDRVLAGMLGVR